MDNFSILPNSATYNAVKIRVNNPSVNVSKQSEIDFNTYNGVDIEVNNPKVNTGTEHRHCVYSYDYADCPICKENNSLMHNVDLPLLPPNPVAYQTNNFINNRTTINAEFEIEEKNPQKEEEIVNVPEPNLTTLQEEKKNKPIAFNGISFKENKKIEILPPEEILPEVNIPEVIDRLAGNDFDIQAQQMEEIAKASLKDPQKAVPYIVTEVFSELINIVEKDSQELTPPSEKQIEIRKQIIINELVKEQALENKQNLDEIKLPYNISKEDIELASELSPMEQAERNKEYALYTMAILSKVYADEVLKHTGNVVPLTDLPGASTIVNALTKNENPSIKVASIDALKYIYRPEYKDEIKSVLNIASKDQNAYVSQIATITLDSLK